MNYSFYLLVIFLLFTIVFIPYMDLLHLQEGLTNKLDSNIILIGDSMLNNSTYIDIDNDNKDNSIPGLIKQSEGTRLHNYAKDGAIIDDCYSQIDLITNKNKNIKTKNALIFISAGGNNIINERNKNNIDYEFVNNLFQTYSTMVIHIKQMCPEATIYLLNLYKPTKPQYSKLYQYIDQWNSLIDEFSQKNDLKVIQTNKLLILNTDFIYDYEPSKTGSQKIADAIIQVSS